MSLKYTLNKHCKHCGKLISDSNKSGYCKICYHKYGMFGENNPFYGKTHKKETIEHMKEKCKIASENLWKNDDYRKRNITACTGLKRSEEFKELQRQHALQQFQDNKQRELRSKMLIENWQNGIMIYTSKVNTNSSKQEKEFFTLLKEYIPEIKQKYVIKYISKETKRKRHLFPDGFLESKKLVIEFHGSFWHADPRYYNENQIIHHGITAKEIWKSNQNKKELYKSLGYKYIEIWSKDFYSDKEKCIKETIKILNNI